MTVARPLPEKLRVLGCLRRRFPTTPSGRSRDLPGRGSTGNEGKSRPQRSRAPVIAGSSSTGSRWARRTRRVVSSWPAGEGGATKPGLDLDHVVPRRGFDAVRLELFAARGEQAPPAAARHATGSPCMCSGRRVARRAGVDNGGRARSCPARATSAALSPAASTADDHDASIASRTAMAATVARTVRWSPDSFAVSGERGLA